MRFVAEYGPNGSAVGYDPREAQPGDDEPTAQQILGASENRLSLTENIYNARGLVEEVRR